MADTSTLIVIFNASKHFVCVSANIYTTAKLFNLNAHSIKRACDGDLISTNKFYFRRMVVPIDIKNPPTLIEYDKICGLTDRRYYRTRMMNRKNWRYRKGKAVTNKNFDFQSEQS